MAKADNSANVGNVQEEKTAVAIQEIATAVREVANIVQSVIPTEKEANDEATNKAAISAAKVAVDYAKHVAVRLHQQNSHISKQAASLLTATSIALAIILYVVQFIWEREIIVSTTYIFWTLLLAVSFFVASLICSVVAQQWRRGGSASYINAGELLREVANDDDPVQAALGTAHYQIDHDCNTLKKNYNSRCLLLTFAASFFLIAIAIIIVSVVFACMMSAFLTDSATLKRSPNNHSQQHREGDI